ncbi:MAG: aldehyde dehydrogenase family protein [Deltaproteobacteria bacterium]|jgi:succinate-semialdehyde dehydrogenase|nr:aldehyde dehydrogenase family protein [Deltaproteobacteria bacterium]
MSEATPENKAIIKDLLDKARAAQKKFEGFSQEAVDKVAKALGKAIFDNAEELAKEAVAETGMGDVDSKIRKQRGVAMSHWDYVKGQKSVGCIENDPAVQVATYAKPIGVIACITPTTNPTSTVCGNGIYALKSRNAIIVAPHPRSKKVTAHAVALVRDAIEKAGGFADLVQVLTEPTIELTKLLMESTDCTIATGGPGMVKSAYSSGRPSLGVGPGNVQTIIDRGLKDLYETYAEGTIRCRTTDTGVQCTAEQTMHLPADEKDAILAEFVKQGCFIIEDPSALEKLRNTLFPGGAINVKMVGQPAPFIAKEIGVSVPDGTKVLIVKGTGTLPKEVLCREKLCPVITYLTYEKFEEGVENGLTNFSHEGAGHSAVVFSRDEAHIDLVAMKWPVCRISVNTANTMAGGNTPLIGFNATMSLGCGSWGNNSISENITFRHMMNTTKVARVRTNETYFNPDTIWD